MSETLTAAAAPIAADELPIEQLCQHLQSVDRRQRQTALETLLVHCEPPAAGACAATSAAQAVSLFNTIYLPVFRCYADRFEQCRQLAAAVVSALLHLLPSNQYYAEIIVSLLQRRIGQPERVEDSEEVRLQLLHQLLDILNKFDGSGTVADTADGPDPLLQCHNAIMDILIKTLTDPYPTIPRTACTAVIQLARCSAASFPARAAQLVGPLVAMLSHRQSPTRLLAVRTLGCVALHLHGDSDTVVRCIVSISPLLMDEQSTVRAECARVGCRWLLGLRDRYSYFERLIPLALCGLQDVAADAGTRERALAEWCQCGAQYYEENEQELGPLQVVDHQPRGYPADVKRPTLGCRAIVQRSLRVCSIVCREMEDWKDEVRLHSLRLLWQVVLHAERALTAKLMDVWPVLVRHCVDVRPEVTAEALRVAALLGQLLAYDDWSVFALAELRKNAHLGQLKCFASMWRHAAAEERAKDLRAVCELLGDPVICHSVRAEYQETLLGLLEVLVGQHMSLAAEELSDGMSKLAVNATDKSIEELLYIVLAKLAAMADGDAGRHATAVGLLSELAGGDAGRLHRSYLSDVMGTLNADLDTENSEHAEPVLLLHGLLKLAGFWPQSLAASSEAIRLCMQHAAPAARIKVLAAVSHAMLGWQRTMDVPHADSVAALRQFIDDIVQPALRWQAGRNAEAVRTMATSVLRSMGEGAEPQAQQIFPELAAHWAQLIDDNNVVTRAYALGCVLRCGAMRLDGLKAVALAVLSRLDDPSGEVRELAVRALPLLRLQQSGEDGSGDGREQYEVDSWEAVVKHLMATLLLHLDSPEIKMRERVEGEFEADGVS